MLRSLLRCALFGANLGGMPAADRVRSQLHFGRGDVQQPRPWTVISAYNSEQPIKRLVCARRGDAAMTAVGHSVAEWANPKEATCVHRRMFVMLTPA